jgi:oligopeptide transport system permease protein
LAKKVKPNSLLRYQIDTQRFKELRVSCVSSSTEIKIHRLFWLEGALPIDNITLEPSKTLRRFPNGQIKALSSALTLTQGANLSSEMSQQLGQVSIFRIVEEASPTRQVEVSIDGMGHIAAITVDGQQRHNFSFSGRSVTGVWIDGKQSQRVHLLGTDDLGRDLWSRILYGGRISLLVGLVATLVSLIIGLTVGAISGYFGGRWDRIIMGGVDVLYAIPFMFLVILLLVLFGRSLIMLFVALGAVQWLTMSRIVRTQVKATKNLAYIDAARLGGASSLKLIFKHILPNIAGPIVIYTTLTIPAVILEESFLSFIGLTVQFQGRSVDSWGSLVHLGMLNLGQQGENSHLLIYPSLAMGITLLGLNLIGDGLRDALDPKQKR